MPEIRPRPTRSLILLAALASVLCACAVGPNFKTPAPPQAASYLPGTLPSSTTASEAKGGEAQRFVAGLDIPGQWWTLFQSAQLNGLIERALAHSPTLEAAQAALREANENVAAERGAYYPSVSASVETQRQRASAAVFGEPGSFYYSSIPRP
jgi:outer membrane protein TolC